VKTFYILAIILSILACKNTHANAKEKRPELPETVGVWQRFGPPKVMNSVNIFDYMNGAGELYLAYRFKKLEVYEYNAADRENILAEIYFMETPDDAFGLLSQDWHGEPVNLTLSGPGEEKELRAPKNRVLYDSGLLRIASGSIFARIMTFMETPESKEAVLSLGRTVVGEGNYPHEPDLLHVLPIEIMDEWKLQRNEICYFRSQLVLNSIYYLSFENIFNLDSSSEAVTALYENKVRREKTNPIRVLLLKYADHEKASQALDRFCKAYLPDRDAKQIGPAMIAYSEFFRVEEGWLGYKVEKHGLVFVFQGPDEKSARSVLYAITSF
jgi:hypothetical protein